MQLCLEVIPGCMPSASPNVTRHWQSRGRLIVAIFGLVCFIASPEIFLPIPLPTPQAVEILISEVIYFRNIIFLQQVTSNYTANWQIAAESAGIKL